VLTNKKNKPTAVVIGLSINALSIVRSLGRKSINVIAINTNTTDYVAKSRYCRVVYCHKLYGTILIKKLIDIGRSSKNEKVLFCTNDLSVLTVSKYRNLLEKYYRFVLPRDNTIKMLMSKNLFYKFACKKNINVPKTFFVNKKKDIEMVSKIISYPCIIKPEYRDKNWEKDVSKLDKILYIKNKSEYFRRIRRINILNNPLIVQEWIEGTDEDVFYCLTYINRNHKPIAVFTGKKIRQFPVLTGSTSLAESIWMPLIAKESLKLLGSSECIGICSVEYKYSKKDNIYYVTEPTVGRTDTQEGSSIESGIDIPYIAFLDALGHDPEPLTKFKEGIKWINEPEDYNSIRAYLKNKKINLKKLIASYRGKRTYALKAMDDPLPFIAFLFEKLKSKISRLFKIETYRQKKQSKI
jgi:predicted ATP-grasp superfamily ATP-dependent carboligase